MAGRLTGKRVLVTGSNDGIGRSIAEGFAREGAVVAAHGRNQERLAETLASIEGSGGKVIPAIADLRDVEAIRRMCSETKAALGGIDVLVNNAGMIRPAFTLDVDDDTWDEHFAVNVKANFIICKEFLPVMIDQGQGGRVINISSISAKVGEAGMTAYNASKHALLGLTRCLAAEMGPNGITVNCICPGQVNTKMGLALTPVLGELFGQTEEEVTQFMLDATPMGEFVEPPDVAELAIFLASDESRFVTAQSIVIDGGFLKF